MVLLRGRKMVYLDGLSVCVQFEWLRTIGKNSRAKAAQTGKIVRPRKILFRKKRRHKRLTVSYLLMKCQVTWLWMAGVLSFTRSNTSWGNWETLVIKTNSTIIVHSLKIIILFPHPINPIYGRQRSFEVPRSVKLHKSCPHRVADSLFTV